MKKIAALCLLGWIVLLTGCNTVQGLGEDIKKGGQVIEDAAKKK